MEQTSEKNSEIDLLELIQKIWKSRKSILYIVAIFFVLGVIVALLSPKEYTATTIMIPQSSDGKSGGSLGGLAAMAGISLGGGASEGISVSVYPNIVKSIPFKQKLVQTPLKFENIDSEISYKKYNDEYVKPSILSIILKYTIGLPSLLFSNKEEQVTDNQGNNNNLVQISNKEKVALNAVDKQLFLSIKDKEGIIMLSYSMPEALPAAQMLQNAQKLLQEAITEFKVQKATEEFEFIKERYKEAEKDFKEKQFALAQFQDRNRDLFGSLPQTRLQQLQTDFNLAFSVYSELAKQLETKRIKVKEDQPVFTIIEPVSVPNEPSKPNRLFTVVTFLFLGLAIGVARVFVKDFIENFKNKKPI